MKCPSFGRSEGLALVLFLLAQAVLAMTASQAWGYGLKVLAGVACVGIVIGSVGMVAAMQEHREHCGRDGGGR